MALTGRWMTGIVLGFLAAGLNPLRAAPVPAAPSSPPVRRHEPAPAPHSAYHALEIRARKILYAPVKRPRTLRLDEGDTAIDTHVHTEFSNDSRAGIAGILLQAAHRGLTAIAITDHNTMNGLPKAARTLTELQAEGRVPESLFLIPGEEISTLEGHVIALYIRTVIPRGLGTAETVARIHAQGGLAIAAHPMDKASLASLTNTLPFDGVETMNGAEETEYLVAKSAANSRRAAFYETVTKPRYGASDAHEARMVGLCYTVLPDCAPTPEAVRAALYAGRTIPSEAPGLGPRTRGLTRAGGWLTWASFNVPTQQRWSRMPMLRVPLRTGTLTLKVNNGAGLLYRHRF